MLDPSSPIFLRQDTVYVPTVFVSFYGDALDEKTPLLRAMDAVSTEVRERQGCTRVTRARRSHTCSLALACSFLPALPALCGEKAPK